MLEFLGLQVLCSRLSWAKSGNLLLSVLVDWIILYFVDFLWYIFGIHLLLWLLQSENMLSWFSKMCSQILVD